MLKNLHKEHLKLASVLMAVVIGSAAVFQLSLLVHGDNALAAGTVYYVDATGGSDSNPGTSPAAAWKTIAKVNTRTFSSDGFEPGDQILFKRGEIWREMLMIERINGIDGSPIVFGAYGTGDAPIITGSNPVTGWTETSPGSHVWQADYVWVNPNTLWVYDENVPAPDVAYVDGERGVMRDSLEDLTQVDDWYWENNVFLPLFVIGAG